MNNIDIFIYFLDTVVKPRYDTERVFRSMQQRPTLLAMTFNTQITIPHTSNTYSYDRTMIMCRDHYIYAGYIYGN
ncbi:MAG TPA: palindromic element RPE4 domain-containing protein [Rickettsia endosymbiont of Bembidion lapponicum]|nr:palindromic element RPE4 domain-containing protein [Rickettsia endosymbiont of Bembidion lapponicum]